MEILPITINTIFNFGVKSNECYVYRYPLNSEEFRQRKLEGLFDPEKAGKRMKLDTPETWETMLSAKGE